MTALESSAWSCLFDGRDHNTTAWRRQTQCCGLIDMAGKFGLWAAIASLIVLLTNVGTSAP